MECLYVKRYKENIKLIQAKDKEIRELKNHIKERCGEIDRLKDKINNRKIWSEEKSASYLDLTFDIPIMPCVRIPVINTPKMRGPVEYVERKYILRDEITSYYVNKKGIHENYHETDRIKDAKRFTREQALKIAKKYPGLILQELKRRREKNGKINLRTSKK